MTTLQDHSIDHPVDPPVLVRPATRAAWEHLRQAGDTPSVRKVYDLVGGAYNTVTAECQVLRDEDARAAERLNAVQVVTNLETGTIVPFLPANEAQARPLTHLAPAEQRDAWAEAVATAPKGPVTAARVADLPDRATLEEHLTAAQAAVTQATAAHDQLTVDQSTEALTLQRLEVRVRTMEALVRLDPTPTQQEALAEARRARLDSVLRIRDLEALLAEQQAVMAQAAQAVTTLEAQLQLSTYNALCAGRAPLVEALERALEALATALEALRVYDAQQKAVAAALGFGPLLDAFPFLVGPTPHLPEGFGLGTAGRAVVNQWVYTQIAALLPAPPKPKDGHRFPPRFTRLADADVAQTPISWAQYQALQAPRTVQVARVVETHRGATNYTNCAAYGVPALLVAGTPFTVSRAHWDQLARVRELERPGVSPSAHAAPNTLAGFHRGDAPLPPAE